MKHRTMPAILGLLLLLAACSTPQAGPHNQEEAAAEQAILTSINEAFAALALQDSSDLAPQHLSTASVEPYVMIRRRDMDRSRELLSLTVDFEAEPPTATAEVALSVTGTAVLWEVYPAAPGTREPVGEKPIDMDGNVTITAQKLEEGWQVTNIEHSGLTQGDDAAEVVDWSVSPDPLVAGSEENTATVTLFEPDTSDEFLVLARGRHLHPRGVLNDNGEPPDAVANDDVYHGYVEVDAGARAGYHLAFIHALNFTKTTDLTQSDGAAFDAPYTDTLLPVLVKIIAGE